MVVGGVGHVRLESQSRRTDSIVGNVGRHWRSLGRLLPVVGVRLLDAAALHAAFHTATSIFNTCLGCRADSTLRATSSLVTRSSPSYISPNPPPPIFLTWKQNIDVISQSVGPTGSDERRNKINERYGTKLGRGKSAGIGRSAGPRQGNLGRGIGGEHLPCNSTDGRTAARKTYAHRGANSCEARIARHWPPHRHKALSQVTIRGSETDRDGTAGEIPENAISKRSTSQETGRIRVRRLLTRRDSMTASVALSDIFPSFPGENFPLG
ncbi:unnamed protein product [Nesidiocoris tenuis]|uniref:Uncharacterized protein n=1 Tax=Nesidiocoris tenuis TaxID=355587 RepID=A0A6H5HDU9_9HEMI|nr:unnamed protein product [Nesidiocoris tenuis]